MPKQPDIIATVVSLIQSSHQRNRAESEVAHRVLYVGFAVHFTINGMGTDENKHIGAAKLGKELVSFGHILPMASETVN